MERRVLWVRTDSIGDNVLASSMLPYIRANFPNARITGVFQSHIAELYRHCSYIDDCITYERQRAYDDLPYRIRLVNIISDLGSDIALNSVYSREPLGDLFVRATAALQRIGLRGDSANMPQQLSAQSNSAYTNLLPSNGKVKLDLKRHHDFLTGLGIESPELYPVVWTGNDDEQFAEDFFCKNHLKKETTLALYCGAQFASRHYPHFGAALKTICRTSHFSVIALGVKHETALNQTVLDQIDTGSYNLSGKTTILQTAAILRRCRLAVGTDTATSHLACAVGTPNVVIHGGGHFGRFFPYSALTSAVSVPLSCYQCQWQCKYPIHHCIKNLDPGVVASAVAETLKGPTGNPRIFIQNSRLWQVRPGPEWKMFGNDSYDFPVDRIMVGPSD